MAVMLDAFDETYMPLSPPQRTIDEVHTNGLWHQTFACWLIKPSSATVFFQLRGPKNRIDPGSYDASASGHLDAGEKPADGFRELEEELGIKSDNMDKRHLGIYRNIAIRGTYINHEFCHVYAALLDDKDTPFSFQEGEVDDLEEFLIQEVINLLTQKTDSARSISGKFIKISDLCNWRERTLNSNYYLKVMLCAQDIIHGRAPVVL